MARAAKKNAPVVIAANSAPTGEINLAKLDEVVKATQAGGFVYVAADDSAILVALELVETNKDLTNEAGEIATRATAEGIKYMNLQEPVIAEIETSVVDNGIDDDIPLPTIKRGGAGRKSEYNFYALQPGQSQHIPATGKRPEPAKSMASAISQLNAKYAKATGETETIIITKYKVDAEGKRIKVDGHFVKEGNETITRPVTVNTREYVIRSVDASDKRGAGARVFRLK